MPTDPNLENEEIDVTAIIERIEKLEEKIRTLEAELQEEKVGRASICTSQGDRITDCEDSIDALAEGRERSSV